MLNEVVRQNHARRITWGDSQVACLGDIVREERRINPYRHRTGPFTAQGATGIGFRSPTLQLEEAGKRTQHASLLAGRRERRNLARAEVPQQLQREPTVKATVQEAIAVVTQALRAGALAAPRAYPQKFLGPVENLLQLPSSIGGVACPARRRVEKVDLGHSLIAVNERGQ